MAKLKDSKEVSNPTVGRAKITAHRWRGIVIENIAKKLKYLLSTFEYLKYTLQKLYFLL